MKKGLVITEKVMPIATRMFGEQAAGGQEAFLNTTGAQHNRLRNSISNAVEIFGKGGFDEGMMRFFKFMADFLDRHAEDIRNLGKDFLSLELAFERITKGGAPLIAMLVPLWGIITSGIGKLGLLVAVLDDISVFVQGGDSVLGQVVNWLSALVGYDYNAVAIGFGVIGVAIAAAFSPLTAAVVAAGLVIEAYNKIQSLKTQSAPTAPTTGAPSSDDINKFSSISLAKATGQGNLWDKSTSWLRSGTNALGNATGMSFDNLRGYQYADSGTIQKLQAAYRDGNISEDEQDRYFKAMGVGMMSGDQVLQNLSMLSSKRNNPNIFPNQSSQPIVAYINGTFNNEQVNITDLISQFSPKDSQPANQVGGATP